MGGTIYSHLPEDFFSRVRALLEVRVSNCVRRWQVSSRAVATGAGWEKWWGSKALV